MDCDLAQTCLLQADSLDPECWSGDLAEHLGGCEDCSKNARALRQLEDDWRHLELPSNAETSKSLFLQQLPIHRAASLPVRRRLAPVVRWAVAAVLLIGVGLFAWSALGPSRVEASESDLVERLIDWNLELSSATPDDRRRLLTEREPMFRQDLQKSKLSADDLELAERLLENGRWMARNNNPIEEAGRFNDIADKLVGRLETATRGGNFQWTQRCATSYQRVWEEGVHNGMERAARNAAQDDDRKKCFEQMEHNDQRQREQFDRMVQKARPEFQRFLENMHKQFHRPPGHGMPPFHGFKK